MSVLGTTDASLDIFGGLVTDMAAADLPGGASPDCANVAFQLGAVQTRPGLLSIYTPITGNPTVNYLKTYIQPNLTQTLLALDSAGTLWGELTPGTLTQIASGIVAGAHAKSATLFGREYIAVSDGQFGIDIPRQYDGTYFDRVSQVGPGGGPAAAADAPPESPITIAASPTGAVRTSGVATITTTVAHNYLAGQYVTIAGVADTSFVGLFVIASTPTVTTFTFLLGGVDSASGGGTVTLTPQMSAGVHQVAVFFQTRQGYFTQPSPPISWTAAGGQQVTITGIPLALGDTNVVARVLAFTASGGDTFYYTTGLDNTPDMIVADNTTTSVTLDFSDTVLLAGSPADSLFQQVELGECAGVIGYSSRLFWWGERNKLHNFENLSFDGAWSGNTPLGWTTDPTYGAGGLLASSTIWGGCYEIIGDGATFTRGMITQGAALDSDGVPRISPNTGYSVRARVKAVAPLTQGTLHVQLYSASCSISTAGLQVTAAQANAEAAGVFGEFIGVLTASLSSIPADLLLRVYVDGTPTNSGGFEIDNIEIFPTAQPYNSSLVRASFADNPESYDGVTGMISILVGVPIAPATQPNLVLALDYRSLQTAGEIISLPTIHASSYTGRMFTAASARKWSPWSIVANTATLAERPDGTAQLFLGNGVGNGKIYELSDAQLSDDGAAISSYYTTYFLPSLDDESSLQTRAHRKLFSYLTCYVEGAGSLNLTAFPVNEAFPNALVPLTLSSPAPKDLELPINVLGERVAFQIGTNQAGAWFRLSRLVVSLMPDPWSPVRGGN